MKPQRVIIHCSASTWGNARVIDDWHKNRKPPFRRDPKFVPANGLQHIGYHYVVLNGRTGPVLKTPVLALDGIIERGRDEDELGAHADGSNDSIGICLIGKNGIFTPNQLLAMRVLAATCALRWDLPIDKIIGHYETVAERAKLEGAKTCPDLNMENERQKIAAIRAELLRGHG